MLKILVVNQTVASVSGGGTAERARQLTAALRRRGAEARLLSTACHIRAEDPMRQGADPSKPILLACLWSRYFIHRPDLKTVAKAVRAADVIHLMNHWTMLNAFVWIFIKRHRKPYLVSPAGALTYFGRSIPLKRLYQRLIGRHILNQANGLVAISGEEPDQAKANGFVHHPWHLIPNGVRAEDFRSCDREGFRRKFGLGHAPFVLFVGRLHPIKGPDLLLEAFARTHTHHPRHHLVIAGPDDGQEQALRQMAARAHIDDKTHFIGYIGGVDKSNAYHAADLTVIPSRQEAMSLVVLESGICGTPVLMTEACGFPDAAKHQGGGAVPATSSDLAEAMDLLLSDPPRLQAMGDRLQQLVSQQYTWDQAAGRLLEICRRAVDQRSSRA